MEKKSKKQNNKLYKTKIKGEKDFYNAINKAMKNSAHKESLSDIIKEFEKYKKYMQENIIPSAMSSDKIFQFRFTYQLEKKVWKDVEIHGKQNLETLAEYIIDEMDWDNDHLHSFFFPNKEFDGLRYWYSLYEIGSDGVENEQYPILCTDEVLVSAIDYGKNPKLGFVFDFGDDHRFMMEFKGTRILKKNERKENFPKIIDQRGVGPEQYPCIII